jgi:hypothetical protein
MSSNEQDFRRLVAGLKIDAEPDPAHRDRLRRQMLQAFEQVQKGLRPNVQQPPKTTGPWRLSIGKLAIAAAAVLCVGGVFYRLSRPADPIAAEIGRTKQAMDKMDWMHVATTKNGDVEHRWYDLAADKLYLATAQGAVWCWDNGPAQRQLTYNPRVRTLIIDNLPSRGFDGSGSVFTMLDTIVERQRQDGAAVVRHDEVLQGRKVRVYRVETARTDGATSFGRNGVEMTVSRVAETFMVDPKTSLMLAGRIEYLGPAGEVIADETLDIDYPQTGPASVYDLGVPAEARVIDRTQQPIGTPGDIPSPTPTPAPRGKLIDPKGTRRAAAANDPGHYVKVQVHGRPVR